MIKIKNWFLIIVFQSGVIFLFGCDSILTPLAFAILISVLWTKNSITIRIVKTVTVTAKIILIDKSEPWLTTSDWTAAVIAGGGGT